MRVKNILRVLMLCVLLAGYSGVEARTYLVAVGIADYSNFPGNIKNLRLTVNDARAITDLYAANNSVDYAILLNEKATKERIVKAMKKVYSKAGPDDLILFFFSGHGYTGGLCAADGKLRYADIKKAFASSSCKNKVMYIDACRSGGIREKVKPGNNQHTQPFADTNIMLFLASRNNENSIESRNMTNGFFTTYLLKGLKGEADADSDKTITAKELYEYVNTNVVRLSDGEQHPVMWGNFKDNMPIITWN